METARALTEKLASLLRREHEALADFLVALADFDRRRAWVELGHASFFYFLHRELRLSLGAAQHRKVAAELIQQVPGVIEPLRRGQLCLSSIIEVAKVVTPDNWETVLPRFYGLSRREAMEVVAELQPHPAPPVRTVVTQVRSDPSAANVAPGQRVAGLEDIREPPLLATIEATDGASLGAVSPGEMGLPLITPCALPVTPPGQLAVEPDMVRPVRVEPVTVEPLNADLSRLHVTVSKDFLRKLGAAADALSHAMPAATEAELLEAGLDLLLAQASKRRGLVDRPQIRPSKGDHIPAHVRREVWRRDGEKCQWILESGGICGATRDLELDHIHPRSLGGPSTADNLRVTCRFHNGLAARCVLGDDLMDRYTRGPRAGRRDREARPVPSDAAETSPPPR